MMTESDRRVLNLLSERVRARFPEARILAYGSRARGDATWESDLDICVILPRLDREAEEEIGNIAWEVGFDNDILITTVEFDEEAFQRKARSQHPFVKNILKDGGVV